MHKQVYCVSHKQLDSYEVPEKGNKGTKKESITWSCTVPALIKTALEHIMDLLGSSEHFGNIRIDTFSQSLTIQLSCESTATVNMVLGQPATLLIPSDRLTQGSKIASVEPIWMITLKPLFMKICNLCINKILRLLEPLSSISTQLIDIMYWGQNLLWALRSLCVGCFAAPCINK